MRREIGSGLDWKERTRRGNGREMCRCGWTWLAQRPNTSLECRTNRGSLTNKPSYQILHHRRERAAQGRQLVEATLFFNTFPSYMKKLNDILLSVYSKKIRFLPHLVPPLFCPSTLSSGTTTTLGQLQRPACIPPVSVPKDHHPKTKKTFGLSIHPTHPISPPKDKIQGRLSFSMWLGSCHPPLVLSRNCAYRASSHSPRCSPSHPPPRLGE